MDKGWTWAATWPMANRFQWVVVAAVYVGACLGAVACGTTPGNVTMGEVVEAEAATDVSDAQPVTQGVERRIPPKPAKWQATPPCRKDFGEYAINGGCWIATIQKPPCGPLHRHAAPPDSGIEGDLCYRAVSKEKAKPAPPASLGD